MQNLNMTVLKRLVKIDRNINQNKYVKTKSLANDREVSEKTIYRDIKLLKEKFNAPVRFDSRRKSFYYESKFSLNPFNFTQTELHTLAVLREMLKSFKSDPYKPFQKTLFEKLKLSYGNDIMEQIDIVKNKISYRFNSAGKVKPEIFSRIEKALFEERRIEIYYLRPGNKLPEKKLLDPYHLRNFEGNWYLVGYDHTKKKIRMLNAGRIEKLNLTNRYFDLPDDFDIEKYFEYSFANRRTSKVYEVIIEINKDKSEDILEKGINLPWKVINLKNGNKRIELRVNEFKDLTDWIMRNNEGIKVIKPAELIKELKSRAAFIINKYKK